MSKAQGILVSIIVLLFLITVVNGCSVSKEDTMKKIPVIYSKHYDITFLWVEKLQSFDTTKYSKTYNILLKNTGLCNNRFFSPVEATKDDLLNTSVINSFILSEFSKKG